MGLSLVTELAPPRFSGCFTGLWFVAVAIGHGGRITAMLRSWRCSCWGPPVCYSFRGRCLSCSCHERSTRTSLARRHLADLLPIVWADRIVGAAEIIDALPDGPLSLQLRGTLKKTVPLPSLS